ncbi:MAG: hypothetical protein ACOX5T_05090 [Candidatus Cryptobacteroides sp.]|jgi:hypothetical protein
MRYPQGALQVLGYETLVKAFMDAYAGKRQISFLHVSGWASVLEVVLFLVSIRSSALRQSKSDPFFPDEWATPQDFYDLSV